MAATKYRQKRLGLFGNLEYFVRHHIRGLAWGSPRPIWDDCWRENTPAVRHGFPAEESLPVLKGTSREIFWLLVSPSRVFSPGL